MRNRLGSLCQQHLNPHPRKKEKLTWNTESAWSVFVHARFGYGTVYQSSARTSHGGASVFSRSNVLKADTSVTIQLVLLYSSSVGLVVTRRRQKKGSKLGIVPTLCAPGESGAGHDGRRDSRRRLLGHFRRNQRTRRLRRHDDRCFHLGLQGWLFVCHLRLPP